MASASVNAEDVQRLGASRVEALLVAHLLRAGHATTAQVMDATGLRQPEVSVGMRGLRERDWVETRALPREGKGRPMHAYHLTAPRSEVVDHYVEQGRRAVEHYEAAMQAMQRAAQRTSRKPSRPATKTKSQRPKNKPHSTTPG